MAGSSNNVNSIEEYHKAEDPAIDLHLPLKKMSLAPKKKLLVLNLNGLLLRRIYRDNRQEIPKNRRPDGRYGNFLFYKRPFTQDFIKFCLERFEVGIWSSALYGNTLEAVDFALEDLKTKLLFVRYQYDCTESGFKSLENNKKPLFLKELKKVWGYYDGKTRAGPYSEANTLLVDDKPYRALLNPPNTAIFPKSYNAADEDDKGLDPKGALALYLKGLADANDVKSYVKDHTFGQPPITSSHPNWDYYSVVLRLRDFKTQNVMSK